MEGEAGWPVYDSWPWTEPLTSWGEQEKVKLMGGDGRTIGVEHVEVRVFEAPRRQCRMYLRGTQERDFAWGCRQ